MGYGLHSSESLGSLEAGTMPAWSRHSGDLLAEHADKVCGASSSASHAWPFPSCCKLKFVPDRLRSLHRKASPPNLPSHSNGELDFPGSGSNESSPPWSRRLHTTFVVYAYRFP